jgi:predicted transcriptional regulator
MRKKATVSDIYYIKNHTANTAEEISTAIGLTLDEVILYKNKKTSKLGRSKVNTKSGPVYQLTEDIDRLPRKKKGEVPKETGVYRSEKSDNE